jgi:hypothetical protein
MTTRTQESDFFPGGEVFNIDEEIANDINDYLDEGIVLVHELQQYVKDEKFQFDWRSNMQDLADAEVKHLLLYNWLALSLVRDEGGDVAAVGVYVLNDQIKVFYTKNELTQDDKSHASQFAQLIRYAAARRSTLEEFQDSYFEFIFHACHAKIMKRFINLKSTMNYKADNTVNSPTAMKELTDFLYAFQLQSSVPAKGLADLEALKATSETNLATALLRIAESVIIEASSSPTEHTIQSLSAHCWILGRSKFLELATGYGQVFGNLISNLGKMGEYFRGTRRLHDTMKHPGMLLKFQLLQLIPVDPPATRSVTLEANWYHVLEVIYYKWTGRLPDVARKRVLGRYGPAIRAYNNFSKSFIRHAEVCLVRYLIHHRLAPTAIGISKFCCPCCAQYIYALNDQLDRAHSSLGRWSVSGNHGSVYLWSREENLLYETADAEKAVKDYIYRQLVEMMDNLNTTLSQSPAQIERIDEEGPAADRFPVLVCISTRRPF